MARVMITGANRGLGLAFVRHYLGEGDQVLAACREPEKAGELRQLEGESGGRLTILRLDVGDPASIREAHGTARAQPHMDGLEVLINNAGIYGRNGGGVAEKLGDLTLDESLAVLRANAAAPLLIAQQFLDLLRNGQSPRLVSISSGYGSVSENTGGFPYHYSASKAALNMYMRSLAADLGPSGIITVVLSPGWVSTDMGGPQAPLTPEQSVQGMARVIAGLTPEQNGGFLDYRGHKQAW